jgi:hypothetical protein
MYYSKRQNKTASMLMAVSRMMIKRKHCKSSDVSQQVKDLMGKVIDKFRKENTCNFQSVKLSQ